MSVFCTVAVFRLCSYRSTSTSLCLVPSDKADKSGQVVIFFSSPSGVNEMGQSAAMNLLDLESMAEFEIFCGTW